MFTRIVYSFASVAFVCLFASHAHAQSVDVQSLLVRMQTIMSEMEALQKEFTEISAQLAGNPTPTVLGAQTSVATSPIFTQTLAYGETNDDIKRIQELLATDPEIYPYGVASGFFGPKTEAAIKNLQGRFGLKQVGVIGPETTALLEGYFRAYPNGNYPDGVLSTKPPAVLGATTSGSGSASELATLQQQLASLQTGADSTGDTLTVRSIRAELDRGEADVRIIFADGTRKSFIVSGDASDEVIRAIAARTSLSVSTITAIIEFEGEYARSGDAYDEDDAEDALDDAEDAIDDADEAIEEAEDDGEETAYAEELLEEAEDLFDEAEEAFEDEDYDEAVELAKEAEDLADDAEDAIGEEVGGKKGDSDEIESIEVEVDEGESEVTVEYEDDADYVFTVEEDKADEIIEEVADELDLDEDDVEDLIEFDYGSIESIDALVDEDEDDARIVVTFKTGVTLRFTVDSADEDDIIEEIADELDEDEDDVEDLIDFDY